MALSNGIIANPYDLPFPPKLGCEVPPKDQICEWWRQLANSVKNFVRISFAHNTAVSLPDRVKIWLKSVDAFLPKFGDEVTHFLCDQASRGSSLFLESFL